MSQNLLEFFTVIIKVSLEYVGFFQKGFAKVTTEAFVKGTHKKKNNF